MGCGHGKLTQLKTEETPNNAIKTLITNQLTHFTIQIPQLRIFSQAWSSKELFRENTESLVVFFKQVLLENVSFHRQSDVDTQSLQDTSFVSHIDSACDLRALVLLCFVVKW